MDNFCQLESQIIDRNSFVLNKKTINFEKIQLKKNLIHFDNVINKKVNTDDILNILLPIMILSQLTILSSNIK